MAFMDLAWMLSSRPKRNICYQSSRKRTRYFCKVLLFLFLHIIFFQIHTDKNSRNLFGHTYERRYGWMMSIIIIIIEKGGRTLFPVHGNNGWLFVILSSEVCQLGVNFHDFYRHDSFVSEFDCFIGDREEGEWWYFDVSWRWNFVSDLTRAAVNVHTVWLGKWSMRSRTTLLVPSRCVSRR